MDAESEPDVKSKVLVEGEEMSVDLGGFDGKPSGKRSNCGGVFSIPWPPRKKKKKKKGKKKSKQKGQQTTIPFS